MCSNIVRDVFKVFIYTVKIKLFAALLYIHTKAGLYGAALVRPNPIKVQSIQIVQKVSPYYDENFAQSAIFVLSIH